MGEVESSESDSPIFLGGGGEKKPPPPKNALTTYRVKPRMDII